MADLGKAYVQIVPSAKGVSGAIESELSGPAEQSGKSAGNKIASGIKKALISVGIGKVIKDTISEGAALEQSIGGIETLFKKQDIDTFVKSATDAGMNIRTALKEYESIDPAKTVLANAANAYKTVGMSANEYMENVTSFSATLLQGLGGDTAAAANYADMAMIDMADNANKMGTSMEAITNAYQGFAKDNYTMLDNLKLGYGGTAGEMARLINDSGVLGDNVEVTAETVKDVPFDQIISAIHTIQGDLGITGTTAKEASGTFTGSFNAMKAAAKNVMGDLALGKDIEPSLNALIETVNTFLSGNLIPMLGNIFSGIASALPALLSSLVDVIVTNLPIIISTVVTLIQTLVSALTEGEALSLLVQGALEIATALANGLITALPALTAVIPQLINGVVQATTDPALLEQLVVGSVEIILAIARGLMENIPVLIGAIPQIMSALIEGFKTAGNKLLEIGKNIVSGIYSGIASNLAWIKDKIRSWVGNVVDFIKNLFKIGSPSKLMRDEVGVFLAQGIGLGFEQGMKDVNNQIRGAVQTDYTATVNLAEAKAMGAYQNAASSSAYNGVNLYIDGIKYNTDDYIDSSISGFVETLIRKQKMFVGA